MPKKPVDRKIEIFNEYRRVNAAAWYIATRLKAKADSDPRTYAAACVKANAMYSFALDKQATFQSDPDRAIALLDLHALSPLSEFVAFCANMEY